MRYGFSLMMLVLFTNITINQNYAFAGGSIGAVEYSQSERLKWEQLAESNNAEAQYRLGNAYCCGNNDYFDRDKAIGWWCKAAGQGHKKALAALKHYKAEQQCRK